MVKRVLVLKAGCTEKLTLATKALLYDVAFSVPGIFRDSGTDTMPEINRSHF